MKYAFIHEHRECYPVRLQCEVLGVSRGGYYAYQSRLDHGPDAEHEELLECVKWIAESSGYSYGSRRMQKALTALGFPLSRDKARKLMREAGVSARQRKKYKVTTNSQHPRPVFDNVLARQFEVAQIDQVYAADITYIWTQEGWLYLAVVMDLCSRKIVGWSMSSRMTAQLVCDALTMAIWRRRPQAALIHHSDRGSQCRRSREAVCRRQEALKASRCTYASHAFRQLLEKHHFIGSMSGAGNCWDNAVVESFFGSLKQERVHWHQYQTRYEAQQDILQYITMFYNSQRLHSSLNYVSPNAFEQQLLDRPKAA